MEDYAGKMISIFITKPTLSNKFDENWKYHSLEHVPKLSNYINLRWIAIDVEGLSANKKFFRLRSVFMTLAKYSFRSKPIYYMHSKISENFAKFSISVTVSWEAHISPYVYTKQKAYMNCFSIMHFIKQLLSEKLRTYFIFIFEKQYSLFEKILLNSLSKFSPTATSSSEPTNWWRNRWFSGNSVLQLKSLVTDHF